MIALSAVFGVLLGLAVGSFLNVVIYRVPAGVSVVNPPSQCPRCGTTIRNRHNVPVLGWVVLRGRCYDCAEPISARYPLIEALTGVLFGVVVAVLLALHLGAAVAAYLLLVSLAVVLVAARVDHASLPRGFVAGGVAGVTALLVVPLLAGGVSWPVATIGVALVGIIVAATRAPASAYRA